MPSLIKTESHNIFCLVQPVAELVATGGVAEAAVSRAATARDYPSKQLLEWTNPVQRSMCMCMSLELLHGQMDSQRKVKVSMLAVYCLFQHVKAPCLGILCRY